MGFNISYTAGGRFDSPFMPTKTTPYVKGRLIEVAGQIYTIEDTFTATDDFELVSIAVGASVYEATDNWDLEIGSVKLFDEIYTKDVPEGIYLIVAVAVPQNTSITFRFRNQGGHSKYVWINYQFLR